MFPILGQFWVLSNWAIVAAAVAAVLVTVVYLKLTARGKSGISLPMAPTTMLENIKHMQQQRGISKLTNLYNLFGTVKPGDFGRNEHGVTFAMAFPSANKFLYTSDYDLARLYLQGDPEKNVPEADKSQFITLVNFIDRSVSSVFSHKTSNPDREKAKKALAPSFSKINLYQTWPYLEEGLLDEFKVLRKAAALGELFDCRPNILLFFFRMLGRSAFGVDVTTDNTEGPDTINGVEYLRVQHKAASERIKEVSMPIRRYMFWNKDVQQGAEACNTLKRICEKILRLHRASEASKEPSKRQSIIDIIAQHPYSSEVARVTDVSVIAFGGHDSTAFSFCLFLMEIAKYPDIRAKLQAEIATVMPKQPLGSKSKGESEGGDDQGQLQHGDQKLLSAICGLEYLNYCIRESMRMWPATANGSARQLSEDLHYKGMILPKGSSIRAHNYSMFREQWIDRPHEFLPERWAPENPQLPELKEMLINFSIGKRACLGQNMAMFQLRIIAAYFLHYFDFELVGEPDFEFSMTLKPIDMFLRVTERSHAVA